MADAVYWIERRRSRRGRARMTLAAAPIDVGPILREQLFDKVPTVMMTSATLATGAGSFDFFKSRIGLTQAERSALGSPFDYQQQAAADPARRHARPERRRRPATSARRSR